MLSVVPVTALGYKFRIARQTTTSTTCEHWDYFQRLSSRLVCRSVQNTKPSPPPVRPDGRLCYLGSRQRLHLVCEVLHLRLEVQHITPGHGSSPREGGFPLVRSQGGENAPRRAPSSHSPTRRVGTGPTPKNSILSRCCCVCGAERNRNRNSSAGRAQHQLRPTPTPSVSLLTWARELWVRFRFPICRLISLSTTINT